VKFTVLVLLCSGFCMLAAEARGDKDRIVAVPGGNNNDAGLMSYFTSARQLLNNGLEAHSSAQTYSGLMPNEDPRTAEMLRQTIDQTSRLISSYRQDGLANMPPIAMNVPGLGALMRLPDKLLRAELSMLQDGIRMAQEMRERPITATMNTPRGKFPAPRCNPREAGPLRDSPLSTLTIGARREPGLFAFRARSLAPFGVRTNNLY